MDKTLSFLTNRGEIIYGTNETDAQMIKEAIRLDYSDTAQHSLFLYRGGNFSKIFYFP